PGLFQLTSRAEKFIWTPGDTARVWVKAVDLKERPVAGQRVTAVASHLRWEKQKYAEEMVAEGQVITGSDGSQTFDFKIPRPGYYLVTLRARDSRGNVVEAQEYLWSTEPGLFFGDAGARDLDVIADKPLYKAGENARIMINANVPNATVLLGIEGRQLFGMRPVTLSGYSAVVDLPIKPEYVPNVFITAALIDGTGYYSTERLIRISSEEKRLDVSVEPERPSYSPGDLARYLVKTRDSSGAPVPAEVSFGLVDSSIYAIRSETTPDIFRFFYGPRPNAVWTNYSFPEYYYGGAEKDGGSMPVRRNFQDTAFWAPVVMTDEQGTARIELTLPDDLTTWRTTVRAHTGGTAVGSATNDVVSRKDLMLRLVTPRFFTQGDEASITALVHNYTSGTARVAVELSARNVELAGPLRRTVTVKSGGIAQETWRIKASSVGSAVITGKAWVTAGQEGPTASGQSGAGSPGQGASAAGDALEVSIPVIPRGEKQVQVVTGKLGSAEPGSLLDQALSEGERVRIPVTVSSDAIPGATSVVLSLAPSIAGSAFGALDYLVSFPYGCVEQTLSSFLPDLAVSRALLELGLEYWREPEELSTMVSSGVQRLYKFQNDEGGWGWWEYDRTDPSLTAYALYGLLLAGRSGFVVDAATLARGLELARQEFLTPGTATGPDDRAFLGYVLALAGPPWSEAADRGISNLTGSLGKLAPKGQALVAMSLGLLGKTAQAREILSKLLQSAKSRADGALHWTDNRSGWTWNEPTVENTAYVLLAFMAVDPSNTRVPDIARWLVSARRGISWNSTKDTAVAILALTEFSKRFERSDASYGVQVYLNGELVDTFAVSPADAFKPARTITLDVSRFGDAVRAGGGGDVSDSRDSAGAPGSSGRQDVLEIRKDMGGVLNYTITLEQWRKKESLQPKAGGIKVERRYYKVIREKNRVREVLLGTARDGIAAGQVGIGDEVKVELTIAASSQLRYVIVEDPLPSGFSPIAEELDRYSWDYWFSRREDRDNKVVFFASWLPAGEKKLTYSLRAEREGSFRVLPTQAWAMYSPDTAGNSAEATLKVAGPR
ncbi:MAG: hypothetical protein HYY08_03390, partial [Firmicutes bacterium]|nr:hypothetical protein [Bacillota bacterium]